MKNMSLRTLPALLLVAFSGAASASAFQLWEQNASGLGVAYAGSAAVADNASTNFFNPAGLTQLNGFQLSAGVAGVGPSFKFKNDGTTGVAGGNGGDAGGWSAVPNAYFSWKLAPDWALGFGVSAPFGLKTEYDSNWIGRFQSQKAEIQTVNYNPSIAYRVNDKVSLGLGLNYQTIDAEMTSAFAAPANFSRLKGDDAAWGWNAGALFTLSPAMRVGVSYRSAIDYTLEGKATSALPGSTPVKADLKLPDTFILSVWQQVSDRWEAMGDLSYTNWSTLQSLKVINRNTGVLVNTERFGYKDSWRIAWGAAYQASDAVKLKFGIAYDRTPTTDSNRSARVPDNNRLWLSLGAQWNGGSYGKFDVGYSYLVVQDPEIDQTVGARTLRGSYNDSAHIVGVQYSVGF